LKAGGSIAPTFLVRAFIRRMADPLKWTKSNDAEKIKAFFGSLDAWQNIPGWEHSVYAKQNESNSPSSIIKKNETLLKNYTMTDMQELAGSRGGRCLSTAYIDSKTRLKWKCAFGHEWEATPRLLKAGHWCPECAAPPWDYDNQAKLDPALAAVYYNNHDRNESRMVDR
jgi:hypothetical protein